jgi:hypothetical protein
MNALFGFGLLPAQAACRANRASPAATCTHECTHHLSITSLNRDYLQLLIPSHTILVSEPPTAAATVQPRTAPLPEHHQIFPTHPSLVAMTTSTPPSTKSVAEQIADLRAVIDNMAASLATMQGNQGQLTVAVNRLQSEKIVVGDDRQPQSSRDPAILAARHGHKLLFPTYDGTEDPLPWLNRCEQFFRIQSTEEASKVFLAAFYMTGDAAQWYALVERNHGTPDWAAFVKLVNQRFGPPLRGNMLDELIQLKRETTFADY